MLEFVFEFKKIFLIYHFLFFIILLNFIFFTSFTHIFTFSNILRRKIFKISVKMFNFWFRYIYIVY